VTPLGGKPDGENSPPPRLHSHIQLLTCIPSGRAARCRRGEGPTPVGHQEDIMRRTIARFTLLAALAVGASGCGLGAAPSTGEGTSTRGAGAPAEDEGTEPTEAAAGGEAEAGGPAHGG